MTWVSRIGLAGLGEVVDSRWIGEIEVVWC